MHDMETSTSIHDPLTQPQCSYPGVGGFLEHEEGVDVPQAGGRLHEAEVVQDWRARERKRDEGKKRARRGRCNPFFFFAAAYFQWDST